MTEKKKREVFSEGPSATASEYTTDYSESSESDVGLTESLLKNLKIENDEQPKKKTVKAEVPHVESVVYPVTSIQNNIDLAKRLNEVTTVVWQKPADEVEAKPSLPPENMNAVLPKPSPSPSKNMNALPQPPENMNVLTEGLPQPSKNMNVLPQPPTPPSEIMNNLLKKPPPLPAHVPGPEKVPVRKPKTDEAKEFFEHLPQISFVTVKESNLGSNGKTQAHIRIIKPSSKKQLSKTPKTGQDGKKD